MRHWLCLLMLTLSAGLAVAQTPHGIEPGDLNRAVQPCTDFFEYANGGWRAGNPIPASMPRACSELISSASNRSPCFSSLDPIALEIG